MSTINQASSINIEIVNLLNYLKKHYEQICKLCAIGDIPYLPSIKNASDKSYPLIAQAKALETSLDHIKMQIRHLLSTSGNDQMPLAQLVHHTELCESLSNYRRDLETLFHELESINYSEYEGTNRNE